MGDNSLKTYNIINYKELSLYVHYRYVGDDFLSVETSLLQSNSRSLRDLVVLESNCTEKDYFCCEEMTENNDKKNISRTS